MGAEKGSRATRLLQEATADVGPDLEMHENTVLVVEAEGLRNVGLFLISQGVVLEGLRQHVIRVHDFRIHAINAIPRGR